MKKWIICEHESIFCEFLIILSIFIIIRPKMVPKMILWASCIWLETIVDESGTRCLNFLWNRWIICEQLLFFVMGYLFQINDTQRNSLYIVVNTFVVVVSLVGYMWFVIRYPSLGKGDTIKAIYLLHIFPSLAILGAFKTSSRFKRLCAKRSFGRI